MSEQADPFDRALHAGLGRWTRGLSPAALTMNVMLPDRCDSVPLYSPSHVPARLAIAVALPDIGTGSGREAQPTSSATILT